MFTHVIVKAVRASSKGENARLTFFCQDLEGEDLSFSSFCNVISETKRRKKSDPVEVKEASLSGIVPHLIAIVRDPQAYAQFYKANHNGQHDEVTRLLDGFRQRVQKAAVALATAHLEGKREDLIRISKSIEEMVLGRAFLLDWEPAEEEDGYGNIAKHACPVVFSKYDQGHLPLEQRTFGGEAVKEIVDSFGGKSIEELVTEAQTALVGVDAAEMGNIDALLNMAPQGAPQQPAQQQPQQQVMPAPQQQVMATPQQQVPQQPQYVQPQQATQPMGQPMGQQPAQPMAQPAGYPPNGANSHAPSPAPAPAAANDDDPF